MTHMGRGAGEDQGTRAVETREKAHEYCSQSLKWLADNIDFAGDADTAECWVDAPDGEQWWIMSDNELTNCPTLLDLKAAGLEALVSPYAAHFEHRDDQRVAVHHLIAEAQEMFDDALDKALEQHQIAATAAAGEGQE